MMYILVFFIGIAIGITGMALCAVSKNNDLPLSEKTEQHDDSEQRG